MKLKDKFKWYARVVKDVAKNYGDMLITYQTVEGCAMAGQPIDAVRVQKDLTARIDARKAARQASKPA